VILTTEKLWDKKSPLKKVQLLSIKAQILSGRKVELLGFDAFFQ